jgi:2-oxoisovalerate dehydrogenase E2 component (dihydrolipoyl transacylase)
MAKYVFNLPDVGEGIVEGEIVKWNVKPGDTVKEDEPLVELMTDKATVSIPSSVNGKVVSTTGKPGDMVPVGAELIVFEVKGDGSSKPKPKPKPEPVAEPAPDPEPKPEPVAEPAPDPEPKPEPVAAPTHSVPTPAPASTGTKALASPAVRRRAREAGIDLSQVSGTGPAGRISHDDMDTFISGGGRLAAVQSGVKMTGVEEVPVIGLRRKIAEKMATSKRSAAHFSYFEEVDITALESLRQHLNSTRAENQPKLTYLPFIIQGLIRAVRKFPQCNALYDEEKGIVFRHQAVHVGISTQTEDGLMVPVIKHAEARDVWDTANELVRVTTSAREKTATIDELTGSTITITSLGAMGGLGATPIINHPEVSIVSIHAARDRAVVRDGEIVVCKMMNLASSFDHRIIDGYDGALLIQELKSMLEHPATIFM